jgi:hypothetical protein
MANVLRIVQWTSGKVATEAVRAVLARPDMELVGAFAFSPSKVGTDLGELCGLGRQIGVLATDDVEAIIALAPDCVLYMPLHPDVDHLERLLGAGINVATTAHFMTGRAYGEEARERLEAAAVKGGASLFGSGVNPGYAQSIAAAATSVSRNVRHVAILESFNIGTWAGDENQDELGWGRPKGDTGHAEDVRQATIPFSDACEALARLGALELDSVRCEVDFAHATRDLDITNRDVRAGTVAGIGSRWIGSSGGHDVVEVAVRWTISPDIRPAWDIAMAYQIDISGEPDVHLKVEVLPDLSSTPPEAMAAMGSVITAMPVVNAVPGVVAARPGIIGYQDLPVVTSPLIPSAKPAAVKPPKPDRFTRQSTVQELSATRIGRGLRRVIVKQAAKTATTPKDAQAYAELAGYLSVEQLVGMSAGKLPWPVADSVIDLANGDWRKVPARGASLVRGAASRRSKG